MNVRWTRALMVVFAAAMWLVPTLAHATTYSHQLCVRWRVEAEDRSTGDFGTGLWWSARGAPFSVWRNGSLVTLGYTDSSTGCLSFSSMSTTGFELRVQESARLVLPESTQFVHAYANKTQADSGATTAFHYVYGIQPSCSGTSCSATINVGTGVQPRLIGLAVAAYAIQGRLDAALRRSGDADGVLHVIPDNCESQPNWDYSCYSSPNGGTSAVYVTKPRKFLWGHEIGHWVDDPNTTYGASPNGWSTLADDIYDFAYPSPNGISAPCQDAGGEQHALRSHERVAGADLEGFAHFVATFVFNSQSSYTTGRYHYYKNHTWTVGSTTYGYSNDLVDPSLNASVGGANAYTKRIAFVAGIDGCWCSSIGNCRDPSVANEYPDTQSMNYIRRHQTGTELDWMRQYWAFFAAAGAKPTLRNIVDWRRYSSPPSGTTYYQRARSMLPSTWRQRWDDFAQSTGIDT